MKWLVDGFFVCEKNDDGACILILMYTFQNYHNLIYDNWLH